MTNLTGQPVGRYHILEQLGEGGMGTVYKAFDTQLEREVAIKFIRPEKLEGENSEVTLKRFKREARLLTRLSHPNILTLLDYGEYEGQLYLVTAYIPGGSLKNHLGKPMPWQEAAHLLAPIARALEYAHSQGVLHRDIKPSNILLSSTGLPILADFGIAKILEGEETRDLTQSTQSDSGQLTIPDVSIGTPEYMSPEQGRGQADQRSDIYSLGIVFYELVTGRKPFTAPTPLAVLMMHATEPLPPPHNFVRGLPVKVEQVILKALAKKPEDRYQDMGEFAKTLEAVGTELSPQWPIWVATVGLLVILITGSLLVTQHIISIPSTPLPSSIITATTTPIVSNTVTVTKQTNTPTLAPMPTIIPAPTLSPGSTMVSPSDGMTLLYVPAGNFLMGSAESDPNAQADEKPQHTVYLDAFWIDRTEVTNKMYAECVSANQCNAPFISSTTRIGYYGHTAFDNYPVIYVSWDDANAYCKWASRRLPTEAEWEKAARGTDGRIYPWGNNPPNKDLLNFSRNVGDTTAVGSYPNGASPYGALDMAGNVWEWVNDWYQSGYYATLGDHASNPQGPSSSDLDQRVSRGGSWISYDDDVRSTNRNGYSPANSVSFRCARSAP